MENGVATPEEFSKAWPSCFFDINKLSSVTRKFPMFINRYYLGLIKGIGDPMWRQSVPDLQELCDTTGLEDPLNEENLSPVPNIIHRYPDRVVFMVSNRCAMYCRFCTRKRKTGKNFNVNEKTISEGIAYIKGNRQIRDVLLSGGDPLLLDDDRIADILNRVRSIRHVEIIRIGSRTPCTLPHRITERLAGIIKRFHPVYLNTHFNHPNEVTEDAARACAILSDAGVALGCQTVLMKGINDSACIMKELMHKLLKIRVKPYYIHHMDITRGTAHFRTSISAGLRIMSSLIGHTSGLCVPHYVIDLPGGGGKIPILPESILGVEDGHILLKNYRGEIFRYRLCREDLEGSSHLRRTGTDR